MAAEAMMASALGGFFLFIWAFIAFIVIFSVGATVFWLWMLIDCAQRKFDDKVVWILIIVLLHFLGALIYYFVVKRPKDRKSKS